MAETKKPDSIIDRFREDIEQYFGDALVSIILYGSAAGGEFQRKRSDINFLVVISQTGMERLAGIQKYIHPWRKKHISLPIFMTEAYIDASLDSFPIEFLNMLNSYRLVTGKDVLAGLKLNKKDIRLQCERELKGKLLQLRQQFILTRGRKAALRALISQSIVTFTAIFRALLFIRGKEIPQNKQQVVLAVCREFTEIEESFFSELLGIRSGELKCGKKTLQDYVRKYIQQIHDLSVAVDRL